MDMEDRKIGWNRRIFSITGDKITPKQLSLISSICQDAFNEGHKAGYALGHEDGYSQAAKEMEDDC